VIPLSGETVNVLALSGFLTISLKKIIIHIVSIIFLSGRLESRIAGSNAEDGETFVTPRSSPDPMDMETGAVNINEQVVDSSSAFEVSRYRRIS